MGVNPPPAYTNHPQRKPPVTTSPGANRNKIYDSAPAALAGLTDGASLLIGGFAGHGQPQTLLQAVIAHGARNLTIICPGAPPSPAIESAPDGLNRLVQSGCVRRIISPLPFHPRRPGPVRERWAAGDLELEIQPAGVLTERIRAGGAGIGGLFLPAGTDTRFAQGRESRIIDGRQYLFQPALKADFALLRAAAADTLGNLIYAATRRNWHPIMAMAAAISIAEVDEIRPPGGLDPELVITPAIFIQRIIISGHPAN